MCVCVSLKTHCYELKNKLRKSVWGVTLSLRKQCERVNVVANLELDCAMNGTMQTNQNLIFLRNIRTEECENYHVMSSHSIGAGKL